MQATTNNISGMHAAGAASSRTAEENNSNPSIISTDRYLKSLEALASDEIKNKSVLLRQAVTVHPPLNLTVLGGLREAYRKQIFSPDLGSKAWLEHLVVLKKYDAHVAGISFARFNSVDVVNLASIDPNERYAFIGRQPDELIVLYGECKRKGQHLGVSKGVTVMGSRARITVGEQSFQLGIPEAVIVADAQSNWARFGSIGYDTDYTGGRPVILTNSRTLGAYGSYPLVYTDQSNVIGLKLDCNYITQGIVGTGGGENIAIFDNEMINLPDNGIFLHDCGIASICRNELSTKRRNTIIGISTANCMMCIQEKNFVKSA